MRTPSRIGTRRGASRKKLTDVLLWGLRHSTDENDDEKRFRRRRNEWLVKRGRKPAREPEPEETAPELFEDLNDLWNDWQTLSLGRPAGMSPTGIPWSEFSRYAEDHGRHGADRLRFCRLMRSLDAAWLGEMFKRRQEKRSDDNDSPRDSRRLDKPAEGGEASRGGA